MKSYRELPQGYREIFSVNLEKNKKVAILINLGAVAIAAVMMVSMFLVVPIDLFMNIEQGMKPAIVQFAVLGLSAVAYLVAHEAVHGLVMKLVGTKTVKFGFTGLYAFAGSDDYYDKRAYITIALAPVVLFGVLFAVLCAVVPITWFWMVYMLQVFNISGAMGDYYVTVKFLRMPKDIVVQDSGIGMTVYTASAGDE